MNQGFRLRYDQMRESDPTDADRASKDDSHEFYSAPSHTRNLCLVWPDGRRLFLNYAYLVTGEFEAETEHNSITLSFTSHTVSLHGYNLERLYMALFDHLPRIITAIDPRYILTRDEKMETVINISAEPKDN